LQKCAFFGKNTKISSRMWENNFFSCSKVLERLKYAQNRSFCEIQKCHFSSKLSAQSQSSNDIDIMLSLLMVLVLVADQLAMQDTESVVRNIWVYVCSRFFQMPF
jgi:hypothetical protein